MFTKKTEIEELKNNSLGVDVDRVIDSKSVKLKVPRKEEVNGLFVFAGRHPIAEKRLPPAILSLLLFHYI
ncbi:hypothetical protein KQX54_015444 [Cotesia glomerata]|uniref:Uncharacterized protein n=1 Tax=Cotesia glomerata TaxID=32391 RepID=A0AAV7IS45_COTGL|nr:hypothetical protein KQX54_015444 [Cotesia glomerata]